MSHQSISDSKPKLTVAIIVRDAEALLASTLSCIRDVADEIIVGDTGSSDGTKATAASLADQVIEIPWADDFSAARNMLLSHASGDWILWLDAGETLSDADLQTLRKHIDRHADSTRAYMSLVRLPNKAGDVSGEQVGRIRLQPHDPRLQFTGAIRETLRPAIELAGLEVESLPITILRSQTDHLAHIRRSKATRDLRIVESAMRQVGVQPSLLLAKAEAKMTLSEQETARVLYQQARAASVPRSSEMLEAFYGELTTYDGQQGAAKTQIKLCVEALELFPLDAQLLCAMGSYLQAQDRVDLATRAYETCVKFGQVNPEIWHLVDIAEVVTICLSMCLQQQQRDDQARDLLEEAIADRPGLPRLPRHLIDLHIKHGRRQEALALVDLCPGDTGSKEAFRSAIRGACLAVEQNWVAAKAYLQTAYHGGCSEAVCFRWLIVTHLAVRDHRAADKVLAAWCNLDPNQVEIERYRQAIDAQRSGRLATEPEGSAAPPRPTFVQAPSQVATTSSGQTMRIDQPARPGDESPLPAIPQGHRPATTPRSFTVDTPARD